MTANNKMIVYATGLSGMIGSRFAELCAQKVEFVNLDLATGVDITKPDQIEEVLKKTTNSMVIHLAAFTDVSRAYQETGNKQGMVYQVNVVGTRNIAAACKKFGHYLIHISTDFVFDGTKQEAYTEADQPHPIEWYGQTKFWAEEEVQKSGANAVICRTAFPFRARFDAKKDLVRSILSQLETNTLHPMFSDQIITPTFIDDLCVVMKVFSEKRPKGIYHCVGSTSLSPFELAQKIAAVFEIKADIKSISFQDFLKTDPRPRQQYLKLSNTKLKQDLGITMRTIDEALQVLKEQING
jgi:dTDP-4-dehydrorhamnose reductase